MLRNVVFLDRDGVINHDSPDYIKGWHEFRFIPGSLDAIRLLTENGFTVIVITNQSAVHRGMFSLQILEDMHDRMKAAVTAAGGEITDIFFCPHGPDEGCSCRKPMPGLVLQAQKKYGIDLDSSCMIGDSAKDIECARNAGCGQQILVRTGNGKAAEMDLARKGINPTRIFSNLYDAACGIVARK